MGRRLAHFHGFIGQSRTVRFLRKQLAGAQVLGDPCPHLLLVGSSGMGKTKLAKALAAEFGTTCFDLHGKATPRQICETAVTMKKADFLFHDESHNLPRDSQEALFEIIDTGRLTDRLGDQQATVVRDQNGKLVIQPITVILATDQPGELVNALQKRMEHRVALNDYSRRELVEIASSVASQLGVVVSAQGMGVVAEGSQGQPRRAQHILKGLRRHFASEGNRQLGVEDVRKYLVKAGMDRAGLDQLQRKYLFKLCRLGSASLETLAGLLGVDAPFARSQIEPGLLKLGFIRIGRFGRCLTNCGKGWIRKRREEKKKHEIG